MRKIMKRAFAAVIVAVMLLTSTPLDGFVGLHLPNLFSLLSLAAEEDIPPYKTFQADFYSEQFNKIFVDSDSRSFARIYYNEMSNDKWFTSAVTAWESIHIATSPSYSLESGKISKLKFYETILFDMLDISEDSSLANQFGSTFSKCYSMIKNESTGYMVSTAKKIAEMEEIPVSELKSFTIKDAKRYARLCSASATADEVNELLSTCKTALDVINKFTDYMSITSLRDGTKEILTIIANDTENPADLRAAASDLIACINGGCDQLMTALINGATFGFEKAMGNLFDAAWAEVIKAIPGGAEVLMGAKGGRAVVNYLFSTDDLVKGYYTLGTSVEVEDALVRAINKTSSTYKANKTEENANIYIHAVDMFKDIVLLGFDYSIDLLETVANSKVESDMSWSLIGNYNECVNLINQINSYKTQKIDNYGHYENLVFTTYNKKYYPNYFEDLGNLTSTYIPITSVSLSQTKTIEKGTEGLIENYIQYTCSPDNHTNAFYATWSSSDESVLKFEKDYLGDTSGEFKALDNGTVTVTCTITEGITDSIQITIGSSEEKPDSKNWSLGYWVNNNEVTIKNYKGSGSCVLIPSQINGYAVTTIDDDAFHGHSNIQRVTIPNSVKKIGNYAFSGCTNLTNIEIPNSVTFIGDHAFEDCSGLKSIKIPDSVSYIGFGAFNDCTGLTHIYTGNLQGFNFSQYKNLKKVVLFDGLQGIVSSAYNSTFKNCTSLQSVIIPNSVKSIGYEAFYNCTSLQSIIIPDGVTVVDDYAFNGCSSLTSIIIPDSVTNIGRAAFENCTGMTSIVIPNSVTCIEGSLFRNCTRLTSLNIPDSITFIGGEAFENCTELISLDIPDSVTNIGWYTFNDCTGLTNIKISNNVDCIDRGMFENCTSLKSVEIPNGVKWIGSCAFRGCTSLANIKIPDSLKSVGYNAFENTYYYNDENNWKNGVLYINNHLIKAKENIPSSYVINSGTKTIATEAFDSCIGLRDVTIPNSVISIGDSAFYHCDNLTSITIPDGVTSLGGYTFYGCSSLTDLIISNSVTSIGDSAFWGCYKLDDVYYAGSEDEWKAISIGSSNSSLKNATIHYNYKKCEHSLKHEKSPATCTSDGAEYDICSKCGAKLNVKVIAASGHKWGEWITVTPATVTASGTEKHICSVCKEEETRTVAKLTGLHDDKSGIELIYNNELGAGTQLKVEQQFSGKSFRLINSAYGEVKTSIFDIATYKDGVKVQPNGEITVKIPLPAGYSNRVFVCYVDSVNGKVTKIPCEVKDGYVIFKTNHFSEYAIVEQSANVKSVSVSDIKLNYKKSTTIMPSITADDGVKYTVKYSSSNTKVATVDENGKVYAAKKGSATITCTVTDSNGNTVSDTCKVTVKYSFGQWLIKILLFGWIWY